MMRRVCDEHGAYDLGAGSTHNHFRSESELPRRSRLLPRHLLQNFSQLPTQFVEEADALLTTREPRLGGTLAEAVEFVARRHDQSEARELREMRSELAECARLGVRAPVLIALGNTGQHAPRRRQLRFEIGKKECDRELGALFVG